MNEQDPESGRRIVYLDGLRAVAFLVVFLFHVDLLGFHGGYLGVDIFFVISGYVITHSILTDFERIKAFSLAKFFLRRFYRLFPALALMVLTCAVLFSEIEAYREHEIVRFFHAALASTFGFINVHFFNLSQAYFEKNVQKNPFHHLWSISVEIQFYLVWSLILALTARIRKTNVLPVLILAVAGLSFAATLFMYRSTPIAEARNAFFYLMPFRLWQFAIGALVFFGWPRLPKWKEAIFSASAFCIFIYTIFFGGAVFDTFFPSVLITLATWLLLIALKSNLNLQRALSVRPMVYIGELSYGLYLWHWPIILLYFFYTSSFNIPLWWKAAAFALTLLSAQCSRSLVEQPLMEYNRRSQNRSSKKLALVGLVAFAVGLAIISLKELNLKEFYSNPYKRNIATQLNDRHPLDTICDGNFQAIANGKCTMDFSNGHAPAFHLILWGDSMIINGAGIFEEFVKSRGAKMTLIFRRGTHGIYPSKGDFLLSSKDSAQNYNVTFQKFALSEIKKIKERFPAEQLEVVLFNYWSGEFNTGNNETVDRIGSDTDLSFRARLEATMNELKGIARVVVVFPFPTVYFSVVRCLASPELGCRESADEFNKVKRRFVREFTKIAELNSEIRSMDMTAGVCDDKWCSASFTDGAERKLLFLDDKHLTFAGAKYLGKKFENSLESLFVHSRPRDQ